MNKSEILSATCLLLSVVKADEKINKEEIDITKEIIADFFKLDDNRTNNFINEATKLLEESIDIFEFGKELSQLFSYQDKIDFICCTYEVAFADGTIDYLEEHIIKKIATMLNVYHEDLIKVKTDIKKYL